MKTIFPKEIIEYTTEAHFAKFNTNIKIIYLLVIVLLITGVLALFVVNIPITQQGRGTIRSLSENNNVISAIYGQIAENRLHENLQVIKGDTLLILNAQKLDNELKLLGRRLDLNNEYRKDLEILLNSKYKSLQTFLYQNELEEYKQNLIELDADIKQKKRDFELNKTLYEKEVVAKVDFENIEYAL